VRGNLLQRLRRRRYLLFVVETRYLTLDNESCIGSSWFVKCMCVCCLNFLMERSGG
jgi:hypothetical protein